MIKTESNNKKSSIKKNFKISKGLMKRNSDDFESKLLISNENWMISKRESMKKIRNVSLRMRREK